MKNNNESNKNNDSNYFNFDYNKVNNSVNFNQKDVHNDNESKVCNINNNISTDNFSNHKKNDIKKCLKAHAIFLFAMVPLMLILIYQIYFIGDEFEIMFLFKIMGLGILKGTNIYLLIGIISSMLVILAINSLVYYFRYDTLFNSEKSYKIFRVINWICSISISIIFILLNSSLSNIFGEYCQDKGYHIFNMTALGIPFLYLAIFVFVEIFCLTYLHNKSGLNEDNKKVQKDKSKK